MDLIKYTIEAEPYMLENGKMGWRFEAERVSESKKEFIKQMREFYDILISNLNEKQEKDNNDRRVQGINVGFGNRLG